MSRDILLEGHLSLDSSVLVEMLNGSAVGRKVSTLIEEGTIFAHTSYVNVAESGYIMCRKIGHDRALASSKALVDSHFLFIEENPEIHLIVSRIKCGRAISLADCYTLAVAAQTASKPLFARREKDLLLEMSRKPFSPEPVFLT